jgi:chromosome segregation ATPase
VSLHEHVAVIAPGISLRRRAALVATARSLDVETSVDAEISAVRSRLRDAPEPVPPRREARRRVAETRSELEAQRERVATARGRMQAEDDDEDDTEYRAAIQALSEAETEHVAAREALAAAREQARAARDDRDERLRLEDRRDNLRRQARRELVASIRPAADAAVSALPAREVDGFEDAGGVSAALALARVARLERPVVLACRRFPDRDAAERWLRAPVHRF